MLGVLKREYGISKDEALWEYTRDELWDLISHLPIDRVTNIQGLKQKEAQSKYLDALYDRDIEKMKQDREDFLKWYNQQKE